MRARLAAAATLIAVGALTLAVAPARAAHPFYERLLTEGTLAFERGDFEVASRDLRLAAFGLLDEPPLLADALTHLALAQAAQGDEEGFQQTFARILEIENRFAAYRQAALSPEVRSAFEQRVSESVPESVLTRSPTFSPLADRRAAAPEPARRGKKRRGSVATETLPPREPEVQAESATGGEAGETQPETPVPAQPASPGRPDPLTAEERVQLRQAREILAGAERAQDLDQAIALVRPLADRHPAIAEVQFLAGEIAYRSSLWADAATYFDRGGDPGEGRPELLFYMAVSFYQQGESERAEGYLRRALPGIERTPFVEEYSAKILGGSGTP